jgi:hypothetical protein
VLAFENAHEFCGIRVICRLRETRRIDDAARLAFRVTEPPVGIFREQQEAAFLTVVQYDIPRDALGRRTLPKKKKMS